MHKNVGAGLLLSGLLNSFCKAQLSLESSSTLEKESV
jgi:hypothetical protein